MALLHQGKHLGDLLLSPRQRGEELTPANLRLVHDLAPQIAMALHSTLLLTELQQLTSALQRSREHLVTAREREILTLIAQGYTNPAIAERLVLSPKTVRNHVSTIFSKLQVASRWPGKSDYSCARCRANQENNMNWTVSIFSSPSKNDPTPTYQTDI